MRDDCLLCHLFARMMTHEDVESIILNINGAGLLNFGNFWGADFLCLEFFSFCRLHVSCNGAAHLLYYWISISSSCIEVSSPSYISWFTFIADFSFISTLNGFNISSYHSSMDFEVMKTSGKVGSHCILKICNHFIYLSDWSAKKMVQCRIGKNFGNEYVCKIVRFFYNVHFLPHSKSLSLAL